MITKVVIHSSNQNNNYGSIKYFVYFSVMTINHYGRFVHNMLVFLPALINQWELKKNGNGRTKTKCDLFLLATEEGWKMIVKVHQRG